MFLLYFLWRFLRARPELRPTNPPKLTRGQRPQKPPNPMEHDCEQLLSTIQITDDELATFDGLKRVMPAIMVQYAGYWIKRASGDDMIYIAFKNYEEQRDLLKPIIRCMNRGVDAENVLLDTIPRIVVPFGDTKRLSELTKIQIPPSAIKPLMEHHRVKNRNKGAISVLLLLSTPQGQRTIDILPIMVPLSSQISYAYLDVNTTKAILIPDQAPTKITQQTIDDFRAKMLKKDCAFCKTSSAHSRCATCGTYYCNSTCQLNDWPEHKPNCKTLRYIKTMLMSEEKPDS